MRTNGVIYLFAAWVLAVVVLVFLQVRQSGVLQGFSGRIEELTTTCEAVKRGLAQMGESAALEKAALQEANRQLRFELDQERSKNEAKRVQLEAKIQDLMTHEHTTTSMIAAPDNKVLPAIDFATSSSKTDRPFARIAEMLKEPDMKEMVRVQQKTMLDMTYKSLAESLDISDADRERLKGLLLEKQMKQLDLGLKMMGQPVTDEERETWKKEIEKIATGIDSEIKALLGEENYQLYQYVEDTQSERMNINLFKQSLGTVDQLGLEQEENLIFAMHKARKDFPFTTQLGDEQFLDPTQWTPDIIETRLEDLRKLEEQYVAAASKILTPEQLQQFIAHLEQQRAMQEMIVKLMFGNPNGSAEPASINP